ncbi:MAG: tetratricopeptide repeat protein [Methylococcales bacterium]
MYFHSNNARNIPEGLDCDMRELWGPSEMLFSDTIRVRLTKHLSGKVRYFRRLIIGLGFMTGLGGASAGESCPHSVGRFLSIDGTVEVARPDPGRFQQAGLDTVLCQDDSIHVGQNSRAAVQLINEVVLRLDQNTTMRLIDVAPLPEKSSLFELITGAFKSFSRPPRSFAVNTPYINGIIEGTEFAMRVDRDSTLVTVYEGKVNTSNDQGRLLLARGESALAKAGQAPKPYVLVKPRDAVQWTLYFPPVLPAFGGDTRQLPEGSSPAVGAALGLVARGDIPGALARLEKLPASERDARYHLIRTALYLDVGRVEEARAELDAALERDPKAGLAYALRSVIEVVRNEKAQALSDAEKAVSLSPSAAAKIALSYAQQADFRLEAARDTLLLAVKEHPDDPLAWARLGELWLMFGEREEALDAARKAEELAPGLARTQTVLGFAALAENRETDAKTAFERAIGLASDDPLAHFGLGLAKIKSGDLAEGRGELEGAVALDSNNALLRSYLGKAYYEEKRFPLEGQQYEIAKELDPADPTAYLYDAIDKQTTNRPVEALQDMQKAIELNGNRAIYRSKQMLDSDLAARSSAIARVYTDLGFQRRALVEGWTSVNTDPTNFSAHRFLADNYSVLPRHEIARVSELLQSQLLQPLNMTPIQPRQAESNLFLISAGGAGGVSFNEFNPIFNRDGLTFQANGLAGENGTYSGEGILAGIYEKAAFSLGYSHFKTDGWRDNADQKNNIGNAFLQFEFSPDTSIQAEYRYRQDENGDLAQRFFADEFMPNQRQNDETQTARVGFHHALAPHSDIIGNFSYQHANRKLGDRPDPVFRLFDLKGNDDAYGGELQHLFKSEYINLVGGAGYFYIESQDNVTTEFALPFPPIVITDRTAVNLDTKHWNTYLYSYLKPWENLTVTVGGSGDFFNTSDTVLKDKNQLNPKFGVRWNPLPDTIVRGAVFRALKRTLITNQTVEPTQVAGFNQFYDEINATDYWVYGGAVDQKFTRKIYAGAEYTYRDLNVPFITLTGPAPEQVTVGWIERNVRTYLFWTPHEWLALTAEYLWERFDRDQNFNLNVKNLETSYVPLWINFFHPSGFGASFKGTYITQRGSFNRTNASLGVTEDGHDDFWLFDVAIKYRLPKRTGFLAVGVRNLFDKNFEYFNTDFNNPRILPTRSVFGSVTIALQ